MNFLCQRALLAALLLVAGCATTTRQVALTGNVMVDGPTAIANGPPRDRVRNDLRPGFGIICQRGGGADRTKWQDFHLYLSTV